MKKFHSKLLFLFVFVFSSSISAATLYEDALNRGINPICAEYLTQIESSYNLNGINLTFANPSETSLFPSLHISSQKYNNGSAILSATLIPDEEYCYLSTVLVTSINNQTCGEITQLKLEIDPELKVSNYADGGYTIIAPKDNSYQIILTSASEIGCTMAETRMIWPGK